MILLIESILIQGLLLNTVLFQWFWDNSCCWSASSVQQDEKIVQSEDAIYKELERYLLSLEKVEMDTEPVHQISILSDEQDAFFAQFAVSLTDSENAVEKVIETDEVTMVEEIEEIYDENETEEMLTI